MTEFILTASHDPSVNLAIEELLFRQKDADVIIYLWQNDNTIVIGHNQNSFLECNLERCRKDHVRIVRRMTGGGAVYHDLGNLNFTFIFSKSHSAFGEFLDIIIDSLNSLGIENITSQRNDLLIDGKKFSGHAYFEDGDRFLFHGTLLISSNLGKLKEYLTPSVIKLASKGIDSVQKRVINLAEIVPLKVSDVSQAIRKTAERHFSDLVSLTLDSTYVGKESRRYADLSLLNDDNPEGSFRTDFRIGNANYNMIVTTSGSRITGLRVYSDSLVRLDFGPFSKQMIGKAYEADSLREALAGFVNARSNQPLKA